MNILFSLIIAVHWPPAAFRNVLLSCHYLVGCTRMFNWSVPFLTSAVPKDPLNSRLDFMQFIIYYQRIICIFVGRRQKFGLGRKLTRIKRHNRFQMCPVLAVTTAVVCALIDQVLGRYVWGLSPMFRTFYSPHVKTEFMIFRSLYSSGDEGGTLKTGCKRCHFTHSATRFCPCLRWLYTNFTVRTT
jgi:hypothetical protein